MNGPGDPNGINGAAGPMGAGGMEMNPLPGMIPGADPQAGQGN